jgi:peptidoglycan/LPS O-acetylase OafA/YrhL
MSRPVLSGADGRNNPWLDLVRSIAILLVLFRHGERALAAQGVDKQGFFQTIFTNGWVGVDLFFVLSGYLIARHLLRAGISSDDFRFGRYLAMRILRIVPAYYAVLFLVVAGAFPFFAVSPDMLGVRTAYHLLFLQDYLPSNINVVFWSLGVEEKFYLLAPVLIFALVRCRSDKAKAALLLLCFALPIGLRTVTFLRLDAGIDYPAFFRIFRSPFHMTLDGLVVGVAVAMAQHARVLQQSRDGGLLMLFGGIAVLCAWLGSSDFMATISAVDAIAQPVAIAVLGGVAVLGAVQLAGTPMPLRQPFQFVSRLSYSLYLIHFPLIPLAMAVAGATRPLGFWVCYFGLSLSAALLLHVVVERPFLRWKDRIAARQTRYTRDVPIARSGM